MRQLGFLACLVTMVSSLAAQSVVYSGAGRRFHTYVGPRTIVRDRGGHLYAVCSNQLNLPSSAEWRLCIARSTDSGKTWDLRWQTGFDNVPAAGDSGNFPCSLAIDSQENLHVTWWHQSSGANTDVQYNRWDRGTQSWGTAVLLVPHGYGRVTSALAVDSKDTVWMVHSTAASWQATVSRSDKPCASDMKFSATTPAFPAQSCQQPALVVDALDRVHLSFYTTLNGATVHHMWLDPVAATPTWSTPQPMGNSNAEADYYSSMAADAVGNVYIVYGVDVQATKTSDPFWEVRKWDSPTQHWSQPVLVYKTTRAQYKPGGVDNDGMVICGACDESTGEFYFTYRNFESGEFLLARWHDGDAAPTTYARLQNTGSLPPNTLNYMLYPNFRGALFPAFNRTVLGLNLIYSVGDQTATTPIYTVYHDPFPIGSLASTGSPRIGTAFPLDLAALQDGGKVYGLALSLNGSTPGLPVDRRLIPVVPDSLFFITVRNTLPALFENFTGTLSASGTAQAKVHIPNIPVLVSVSLCGAFLTVPGGPVGVHAISNPYRFTIVP